MSNRYSRILSATFNGGDLPLPLAVQIARKSAELPAGGDADAFSTSVQIERPVLQATVRIRGTATAEQLALGQSGSLVIRIASADGHVPDRTITIDQAVLTDISIDYQQTSPAAASLRFVAQSSDGQTDPFGAEDSL
ncbi:MAG: hypothetical protein HZA50_04470 [Planctomycetes bacterium]|nr:hypothetical protein [Planctomycetota bacterium]